MGTPRRKFKGPAVYQGNIVKDQDGNWAIFQELPSSKVVDFYALLRGHSGEQADAEMAYTQAAFNGPATWFSLPPDQWPPSWRGKYRQPVCRLLRALYGHTDSGGPWGRHCDAHLRKIGFKEILS